MITFLQRKSILLMGIYLLIPIYSLLAQQHYTLQNLIDVSVSHLPVLQQKQALVNSARASLMDVRHSLLPQLKLSEQLNMGSDNSLAGSSLPLGITPSTSGGVRAAGNMQPATGNIAVLYSEYELANFGLNAAKIKTAQSFIDLQQSDYQKEAYLLKLQVAKIYFNALKIQYRLETDHQNVNRYDSIFKIIRALTLSGLKAGSDSSLAKAELSKARITFNQSQGNLNQLKEQLSFYTGIPSSQLYIDSLANSFLVQTQIPANSYKDTVINPLIDYYDKKKNIFLSYETLIKKTYMPKVFLAGSTWARGSSIQYNDDYKSLGTGLGYQRVNYAVGIAVTYNLFSRMYTKDKLAVNRFDLQASELELQQQKLLLNSAELQADNALQTTQANLSEMPVQLK